jgi:hypothetical protein
VGIRQTGGICSTYKRYGFWDQIEVLLKDFALVEVREGRIEGLKIPSG